MEEKDKAGICLLYTSLPGNNNYAVKILRQADLFAQRAFNPGYVSANSQPPRTWFQSTDPPISFSVDFTPPVAGNYNLLTVNAGNNWTANNASNLQIPDDWAWVLKWGALYDLLSRESSAKDALRAEYCLRRYKAVSYTHLLSRPNDHHKQSIRWAGNCGVQGRVAE